MAQAEYDRLAHALPHDEYLAQCGAYQACRRAVDLVDTLIEKADQINGRERTDAEHREQHRNAITFGTPHYKP